MRACGLNHSDLDSRAGTSRWPFPMPWVLGAEFAGTVARVGADVEGVAPGDPVTAYQQYACGSMRGLRRAGARTCASGSSCSAPTAGAATPSWCVVPARAVIPLRGEDDFVTVGRGAMRRLDGLVDGDERRGDPAGRDVLVPSASGGVAGAAVQAAVIAGARVIASVGAPEKADAVLRLGADVVFCYLETPVADAVADATGGRGVDAVVDTTGGPRFAEHLAAMAPDGRLVTCGAHAGEVVPLDIVELFRRGHRILGFRVATPDEIRTALEMALAGRISVPVDRTFRLAEAAEAHAYMAERRHVGKIVLVP